MSTDTNLLWERSVSSSPNPCLVLDTEVHGSLLSLRSYQKTADSAKQAGLFSHGLRGNQRILTGEPGHPPLWFSAIAPRSGIPELGADEDARRAEEGRGGTMLCALAHDRQTISSSTPPKSPSAFEKTASFVHFSHASFRQGHRSQISPGLSLKFPAREAVLLHLVPQGMEGTFPLEKDELSNPAEQGNTFNCVVVERIYSML